MQKESIYFPDCFLFGTATSSLQIEGGDKNNSWFRWSKNGHIKDGSNCFIATDHWNRYSEDIQCLKQLNCKTYRMSIEWARIEPERNKYDEKAISHYRQEIEEIINQGIKPIVTLHHFSNPIWFEDRQGWLNENSVTYFLSYVEKIVYSLGDLVNEWITINEPNVYMNACYLLGIWPPGQKRKIFSYVKGARNMLYAHKEAYKLIHNIMNQLRQKKSLVGIAIQLWDFEAANNYKLEKILTKIADYFLQEIFIRASVEGIFLPPIGIDLPEKSHNSQYVDFLGVNYYTKLHISTKVSRETFYPHFTVPKGITTNDLGWGIFPEGLYSVCKKYYDRYHLPIFITENGTCDENDSFRPKFLYDHLKQVHKLIRNGVDVQRYYHWSLLDNFEWAEGLRPRFGLYKVNYKTLERTITRSGEMYQEICENNAITDEIILKYLS